MRPYSISSFNAFSRRPALFAPGRLSSPDNRICCRQCVEICCFGASVMFLSAALSSASKKATLPWSSPQVDLDMSSGSRPRPVDFAEDVPEPVLAPPDLSASAAPVVQDVLPPASPRSPPQETFRRELFSSLSSAFEVSAASGAVRTYAATLRSIAPKVMSKLGCPVLPMLSEQQFFAYFGPVLLLGPKSASPVSTHSGVRWSYVQLVKAAIAYWRAVRGQPAVFGSQWSPRMRVFWSGVKRSCVHASAEKLPLLLEDARGLCRRAEVTCSRLR